MHSGQGDLKISLLDICLDVKLGSTVSILCPQGTQLSRMGERMMGAPECFFDGTTKFITYLWISCYYYNFPHGLSHSGAGAGISVS